MTKDLTERQRYFIYSNSDTGLYTTFGEYVYLDSFKVWTKQDNYFEIREGIDQEVPDTFVRLSGMPLAVDKT